MGGMRMGADPRTSVTDADGLVRGLDNVGVADASVFPTSGAHNPTLTLMAVALRNARRWVGGGPRTSPSRADPDPVGKAPDRAGDRAYGRAHVRAAHPHRRLPHPPRGAGPLPDPQPVGRGFGQGAGRASASPRSPRPAAATPSRSAGSTAGSPVKRSSSTAPSSSTRCRSRSPPTSSTATPTTPPVSPRPWPWWRPPALAGCSIEDSTGRPRRPDLPRGARR